MAEFAAYDPDGRGDLRPAVVRPAVRDDLESLTRFDLNVVTRTRDDWATLIDKAVSGERLLLVAEVEGTIAAYGQAHHLDAHPGDGAPAGWYLTGLAVIPSYRRAGLARRLTTARLDWIDERADAAWYFANATNLASIRLHDELGFVEVAHAPSIQGVSFDGGTGVLFRRGLPGRGRP